MHPDSKKPTDKQRKNLLRMLMEALVQIRALSWNGENEHVSDLADAFHNLPVYLESDEFSFDFFRTAFIEPYHRKYPPEVGGFNYLEMLEKIIKEEDLW